MKREREKKEGMKLKDSCGDGLRWLGRTKVEPRFVAGSECGTVLYGGVTRPGSFADFLVW